MCDIDIRLLGVYIVVHGSIFTVKNVSEYYPTLRGINFLEDKFTKILAFDLDEAYRKYAGLPGNSCQYGLVTLFIFTDCLKIPNRN